LQPAVLPAVIVQPVNAVVRRAAHGQNRHDLRQLQPGAIQLAEGIQLHLAALIQQHQPPAQFAPGGFQQLLGLFHIPFGVQRPQLRRQLIGGGVILPHPVAEQRIAHQPDEGGRYQIVADPHDEQEGEHDLPSDGRKGMFSPCR